MVEEIIASQNKVTRCAVCSASALTVLWELPLLPLTEKHGPFSPEKCLAMDQNLLCCSTCGHIQLGSKLSPSILYTASEYSYRTSQSNSTRGGCQFFYNFLQRIREGRSFTSLLDVGGNDLYLAKMLGDFAHHKTVIDPICEKENGQIIDGIKVLGCFVEDVDLKHDIPTPDLIICRHVLEHISEPRTLLRQLFDQCSPEALYIFEIPCFDMLVEANRFDAIFHQHYHYYDIDIMKTMIHAEGGEYLDHAHHYQGSCGGSLLVAFRKAIKNQAKHSFDIQSKITHRKEAIHNYQLMMRSLARQVGQLKQQVYGYGASLMLATLAYHMKSDLSELICILDDDPSKDGWEYQNVPVKVQWTQKNEIPLNSNFLITSLENVRPIFSKLVGLQARRILFPGTV